MLCDTCKNPTHCENLERCVMQRQSKSALDKVLDERGKRYGKFVDVAKATTDIQLAVYTSFGEKVELLNPDQMIALDMICHKIARIAVGDANYVDNWVDISGYAQLVADRLNGIER